MDAASLSLALLEAHDPRPSSSGDERDFLCPLDECAGHQSRRNLSANTSNGFWTCHRCGASGLLVEFREDKPAINPRDVARVKLSRLVALPAAPPEPVAGESVNAELTAALAGSRPVAGTPGEQYLAGRGIPVDLATAARVGYIANWLGGGPAVLFQVRDKAGRLVSVDGRRITPNADPKTLTRGPKGKGVFSATPGALDAEPLTIVEGPIDALSLVVAGVPAVALCGKTWPGWLVRACALGRRSLIALDGDASGDEAAAKLITAIAAYGGRPERWRPDGVKDWNDQLTIHGVSSIRPPSAVPATVNDYDEADQLADLYVRAVAAGITIEPGARAPEIVILPPIDTPPPLALWQEVTSHADQLARAIWDAEREPATDTTPAAA